MNYRHAYHAGNHADVFKHLTLTRLIALMSRKEHLEAAKASAEAYQAELTKAGLGTITTEIEEAPTVYFAEAYHQQYLAKNPQGYCGIGGTGVTCPI